MTNEGWDPFDAPVRPGAHSGSSAGSSAGWVDEAQASRLPGRPAILGPPLGVLAGAAACGVVGGALAVLLGTIPVVAFVAWLIAGPGAFSLLGLYGVRDARRRAAPIYVSPSWVKAAYWVTVALALIGVVLAAWQLAQWAGRTW